eukprot:gene17522-19273_t
MRNQSKIPRLISSSVSTRLRSQMVDDDSRADCTSSSGNSIATQKGGGIRLPRESASIMADREKPDTSASFVSLPALVDKEVEVQKTKQVENVQPECPVNQDSHYSVNRYTTLPPIQSDLNTKHPISFMVPHHGTEAKPLRKRLPPISLQQQLQQQHEEKPDSLSHRASTSGRRKEVVKSRLDEERETRELRRRQRTEHHERKKKELEESCEVNRLRKLEHHRRKLELADQNKEELRQQRKRKLEYQEERRRRAREKFSQLQKGWPGDTDDEDADKSAAVDQSFSVVRMKEKSANVFQERRDQDGEDKDGGDQDEQFQMKMAFSDSSL